MISAEQISASSFPHKISNGVNTNQCSPRLEGSTDQRDQAYLSPRLNPQQIPSCFFSKPKKLSSYNFPSSPFPKCNCSVYMPKYVNYSQWRKNRRGQDTGRHQQNKSDCTLTLKNLAVVANHWAFKEKKV